MKDQFKKIKCVILPAVSIIIAGILLFADFFIKRVVTKNIPYNIFKRFDIIVIKNFFSITNTKNTGAAWSIFSEHTLYLTIFTSVACVIVLFLIFFAKSKWLIINLGIILGGACGNLLDRLLYGYVTDYLDFTIFGYAFPVFNLADICLVVGCIMLMIFILFIHKENVPLFRFKICKGCLASKANKNICSTAFGKRRNGGRMNSFSPKEDSPVPVSGTDFFEKDAEASEGVQKK